MLLIKMLHKNPSFMTQLVNMHKYVAKTQLMGVGVQNLTHIKKHGIGQWSIK